MNGQYEVSLVLISLMVAVLASYTALTLAERVSQTTSMWVRWWWIVGGAFAMGTGIWAMHFIGMLAFRLPIPLGYDLFITLLSWALPVAVSVLALWQLSRKEVTLRQLAASAVLIGIGINVMHYVGMAAMQMQPAIVYVPKLVAASTAIAVIAAGASVCIAFKLRRKGSRAWWHRGAAAGAMGAAIAGMHYTGMAAAIFSADSVCRAASGNFTLSGLAMLVIVGTVSVLGIALLTAIYDARLEAKSKMAVASERNADERQHSLDRERALRAEAERLSALKDQFLATLSHELRTPLNAILGWAQLLKLKKDPASMERGLQVIDRNARLQAKLIEDLLDMSRVVSGKVRLELEDVDLGELVRAQVEAARPAATAKLIDLTVKGPTQATSIRADSGRLQQILWNLVANAIKFTPEGGRVVVEVKREGRHVLIAVSDTGIGIQPDFLPYVFDPFRQADASTTRRYDGLGIGLAIAKQLAELHGGTLDAASEGDGTGARLTLHLPLSTTQSGTSADHANAITAASKERQGLLKGASVLLVEDDMDTREMLHEALLVSGAQVTSTASAMDALRILQQDPPDVMLSDIGMAEMDGFELIRRIRESTEPRIAHVPAIALTAYTRDEDERRALDAGFTAFHRKPLELNALIEAILELTKQPRLLGISEA